MSSPGGDVAISKTQRWLDLIAFLVARHFPVPVDEVMRGVPAYRARWRAAESKEGRARDRALASLRRMFERDKDELRVAGIPLETVDYRIEGGETAVGYRLPAEDFYLPYLRIVAGSRVGGEEGKARREEGAGDSGARGESPYPVRGTPSPLDLTAEDARTAIDSLRSLRDLPASPFAREARSALTKLTFDLAPVDLPEVPVLFAEPPGADAVRGTLRTLTDALRSRARVRFRYHGIRRGEATDRDVAPYGLLFQHGQWYLVGADATRDGALRVFRVSRIAPETLDVGTPGAYGIPDDFDASSFAGRQPWELGDDEPVVADVRFAFPLCLWAERNERGEAVEEGEDGAVVRRFEVRQTGPFLRWLQGFAGDAVVVRPPELRAAQAGLARRTLEVYGR